MKKLLLLVLPALFAVSILFAQDDELPPPSSKGDFQAFKKPKKVDLSKFIIEPNFVFSLGNGRTDVGLSPYVGYNVWKGLCVGGGITYFYTGFGKRGVIDQFGNTIGTVKENSHTYGGGVFVQYNIWRGLFGRARFEVLERDLANTSAGPQPKDPNNFSKGFYFPRIQKTMPALLVGAGYNLLQSKNFFFPIMISYNVLNSVTDQNYSIYPRGVVIQLGFINLF